MPNQTEAPLAEAIARHAAARRTRFHVPGHKGHASAFSRGLTSLVGRGFLRVDLTELPELDDLHCPAPGGPVERAQNLAAEAFGAREARFLAGGSTAGVIAMVLAVVGPGQTLLATQPFHRSVAAAAILAGCDIRVVPARLASPAGVPVPAAPEVIAGAVAELRPAALLVTSPTYHGAVANLPAAAEACRGVGAAILVDAAHGAHFGFASKLPPGVSASGATAWVLSLHKTAGALTPGAMLLLGEESATLDRLRLAATLRFVQTSSPSFPVLASVDLARRRLALRGRFDWAKAAGLAEATLERVIRLSGGRLVALDLPEDLDRDPTRLVLAIDRGAPTFLTGSGLARVAAAKGVDVEMAGWGEVVAVVTPGDTADCLNRLAVALGEGAIRWDLGGGGPGERELAQSLEKDCWETVGVQVLPPREAFRRPRQLVSVDEAVGRVAADVVCPYPPGVPLVLPGQRISEAVSRYLAFLGGVGLRVHGISARRPGSGQNSLVEVAAE